MSSVSATSLSGLYANETRINVAAQNIANVDSENYKAQAVQQSTDAAGGVDARVVDKNPPSITVSDTEGGTEQRPNVDLAEEVVNAQVATYSAEANLKVLKAQDKLDKYLLNIQA